MVPDAGRGFSSALYANPWGDTSIHVPLGNWYLNSTQVNEDYRHQYSIDVDGYIVNLTTSNVTSRVHLLDPDEWIPEVIRHYVTTELRLDFLADRAAVIVEVLYGRDR